jgi:predicted thioesterase
VSTEAKLVKIRMTPTEPAKGARTERMADLMLMPNGDVSGKATITWSENAALRLRQKAIRDDEHAVKRDVEKEVQGEVPPGVEVKLESLEGLDNADVPLVATLAVSGKMGQATRKRIVLPSQFFASTGKPVFVGDIRTQPIAFPEAYTGRDKMRLRMPAGYVVESLPDGRSLATAKDSGYASNALPAADDGSVIVTQRAFSLNRVDYKVDEYRGLRQYFQQVADYDQDQIILKVAQGGGDAAASVDAKP